MKDWGRASRLVGRRVVGARGLLLVFALLLAACGPEAATNTAVPAPTSTAAVAPATKTTAAGPTNTAVVGKTYTIGILQTATHPALDFAQAGIKQAFAAGVERDSGVVFDVRNAELDAPTAAKLAQTFIANNVDAIVTIGSLTSAAALAETQKAGSSIPVIFCAVADPYVAKLAGRTEGDTNVPDPTVHPANVTGVQAFPPVEAGMSTITEVKPGIKRVGLLWNPNEPNSQATTDEARRVAQKMGIELVDRTATAPGETLAAAQALAGFGVEAFFVSTTNSVVNGLDSVVRVAQENKIPLFGNDPLSASRGAVAALGLDYQQNGVDAGNLAARIVTGQAKAETTDIQKTETWALCVNTKAAELQSVTLPESLLSRAANCTYTEIKNPQPLR